jgi:hypothetical protein
MQNSIKLPEQSYTTGRSDTSIPVTSSSSRNASSPKLTSLPPLFLDRFFIFDAITCDGLG